MAATTDDCPTLLERIEVSTLDQMIGWGADRYQRVFRTLAAQRAAIEDSHRHVHQDGTVEDPDPRELSRALERVDAAEVKIIAAITKGSRAG
ncbi:hypothetical protein ACH9D2_18810 [Kocuria sp. M4R2S49]|uniref:hypothetical protein n=1 Tax=Kocuria rhizosphaericola TaxID=3376284 RepID=UPI0037874816